jgi:hypothetical protein
MDGELNFTLRQRSGNLDISELVYRGLRDEDSTKRSALAESIRRLTIMITEVSDG